MSQKFLAFILLLSCVSVLSYGQSKKTAIIKGRLLNSTTKAAFNDLKISIPVLNVFTTSDGEGNFEISEVPYGPVTIVITAYNATSKTINIFIDNDVIDLMDINIAPNDAGASPESIEIPTIALEDNNSSTLEDDGVSTQNTGGLIISSRDPFINTLAYIFSLYHFQPRGYQRNSNEIQVNGIPINDVETGYASWNTLGGLNDVFHGRDVTYGLSPSAYTFGGINGSAYVEATAADQRKGMDVSYMLTDRNYNNRIMLTENTGLMKNGWAFSFSGSRRWAQEGYVPGTSYDGYSYYGSASKVIKKGILSLTTFGSPTYYTKAAAATKEADSLAHSNYYNHNWGLDSGQVRNLGTRHVFQPITILNYEYRPSDKTRWNTAVSYEFGKDRNGGYGYDDAANPLGDYYKKLPSYYLNGVVPPDPTLAATLRSQLYNNPGLLQINWNDMYYANEHNNGYVFYNTNGQAVTTAQQNQSQFILFDRVDDLKKFTFNTNVEHSLTENITLSGGLTFTSQHTESYYQLTNLLGGDYYLDYNTFATQQSIVAGTNLNNVRAASPVVGVGDKINNDYLIRFNNSLLWGQAAYTYDKFDLFVALNAGSSSFNRDGYMENGLFPNNSYGNSPTHSFFDYAAKGGIDYKIDARNILFVNAAYTITPPTSDNTYISVQTRDFIVNNPTDQHTKSLEAGYMLRASNLTARVVGYVTDVTNITEIKRFFNDDPSVETYENYVMQGESTRSIGTELALNYKFTPEFSVLGVATIGQAFYTNNPNITVYLDDDTAQHPSSTKTYIKNYYLGAGPQTAMTLGLNYRPKIVKYSYVSLNFNYFDRNYVTINPDRRTTEAAAFYVAGSPEWHEIFDQEKLPAAFTVDLRFGKNFMLSRKSGWINKNISHYSILALSAGISNLLNNTNVINTGFEQLRYDFEHENPLTFPNKYLYGPGINFYLSIALKF